MSPVNYRPAVGEDIPALIVLLKQLFSIEEDFVFNQDKQQTGLELMIASAAAVIIVAEENQKIIGMATGQTVISTAEGGSALIIEDVIVAESHRRAGVGGKLLAELGSWAEEHDISRMQLLADKNNEPAIHFYKNSKWTETALICFRKII